jgi:hypothetical protein
MKKSQRDLLAERGVFVELPSSAAHPRAKASDDSGVLGAMASDLSNARGRARARIEQQTAADIRGYGGRRIGFEVDAEEQVRMEAMESHLLELARRAIAKDREVRRSLL